MILKRFFAEIIDCFIIGLLFAGLDRFSLPEWFYGISFNIADIPITIPSVGVLIVIIPMVIKDLLFKNASIGKKIMALVVVDDKRNVPDKKTILKRGILMPTLGYMVFVTSGFDKDYFEMWELNILKTMVVNKKEL